MNSLVTDRDRRKLCRRRMWFRSIERFFAIVGVLLVTYHLTLMETVIVSPSMAPTLQGQNWSDGDRVLTETVSYRIRRPRRWEVMTFRVPDGTVQMKRVIGLPGETVQMQRDGTLVINGNPVTQPAWLSHIRYLAIGRLYGDGAVKCRDRYFVLGDDSKDSDDSRFNELIQPGSILGRSWVIVQPWNRFGWVNGW